RLTAKEDANGYSGTWNASAFAVCAKERPGFTVESPPGSPPHSVSPKVASVICPTGTLLHNIAVASSGEPPGLDTTPPGVGLQALVPAADLRSAFVVMAETTPTNANWDMGPFAICGP